MDEEETLIAAEPVNKQTGSIDVSSNEVMNIVDQFMEQYMEKVLPIVRKVPGLQVHKAEKTEPHEKTHSHDKHDAFELQLIAIDKERIDETITYVCYRVTDSSGNLTAAKCISCWAADTWCQS